jgi:hypothetical protein
MENYVYVHVFYVDVNAAGMTVKSTMSPHRNIYKFTWTSPGGKTYHQI